VAVAAISLASLVRAQSGIENARAYASPLIAFFSSSHPSESSASSSTQLPSSTSRGNGFGNLLNLLPVFFVGLVAPLSLLTARSALCVGRALPAPDQPGLFQRPPPTFIS
jgi:hypothetical protein